MKKGGLFLITLGIILLLLFSPNACGKKKKKIDIGLPYTTKEQLKELETPR